MYTFDYEKRKEYNNIVGDIWTAIVIILIVNYLTIFPLDDRAMCYTNGIKKAYCPSFDKLVL